MGKLGRRNPSLFLRSPHPHPSSSTSEFKVSGKWQEPTPRHLMSLRLHTYVFSSDPHNSVKGGCFSALSSPPTKIKGHRGKQFGQYCPQTLSILSLSLKSLKDNDSQGKCRGKGGSVGQNPFIQLETRVLPHQHINIIHRALVSNVPSASTSSTVTCCRPMPKTLPM